MKINANDGAAIKKAFASIPAGKYKYLADDVAGLVSDAEDRLALLPVADRQGARLVALSGGPKLPNSYKATRKATRLHFERGARAWFLTSIEELDLWPSDRGCVRVQLDSVQRQTLADRLLTDRLNF